MAAEVSVIIPNYNRCELIQRAIESVRNQTVTPRQIIVVDDGSDDASAAVIRRMFPDICVLQQPHKGVSAARNYGINHAACDWLAFLDSDDEWLPEKLERQMHALADAPNYRVCHSNEIWIRDGRRVNQMKKHAKFGGNIFEKCLPLCAISPSAVVIHKEIFSVIGVFDESLPACEDYDLWLRLTVRYPVLYLSQPLIRKYGGHHDQLSRQFWGMDRFRIQALFGLLQGREISPHYRRAAVGALIEKIEVYAQGAEKRGRNDEAALLRERLARLLGDVGGT